MDMQSDGMAAALTSRCGTTLLEEQVSRAFDLPCGPDETSQPAAHVDLAAMVEPHDLHDRMHHHGFNSCISDRLGAYWGKFLASGHTVVIRLPGGGLGEQQHAGREIWQTQVFDGHFEEVTCYAALYLTAALRMAGQAEALLKPPPVPGPNDMPYLETVARKLCQSRKFAHPWLDSCSSGELIALCLAVGTPAALRRLSAMRETLGDAWADIDQAHRAIVQRVWDWQRHR